MPSRRATGPRRPLLRRRALRAAGGLRGLLVAAPRRVLVVWLVAWTVVEILASHTHMYSWHYALAGAATLRSPTWFLLYGQHPELQMGPLTFVVAEPFSLLPPLAGRVLAAAAMAAVGLLVVRELHLLAPPAGRRGELTAALLHAMFLVGWLEVAVRFGHLDDVMALLCATAAVRRAVTGRVLLAAVLVGLAVDFKPWTLPVAAVLLVPPAGRRAALAAAVLLAVVAAAWLPFLLLDPAVLHATGFVIHVDPASTLHLLPGAGSATPAWCRPAQLAVGALLALLAARSGRWQAVPLVVIAVRLLLDPAVQPYYDSGLLLGSVLLDLVAARRGPWRRWPLGSIVVLGLVYLPSYVLVALPEARGALRTAGLVALLALAAVVPPGGRPSGAPVPPLPAVAGTRGRAPVHGARRRATMRAARPRAGIPACICSIWRGAGRRVGSSAHPSPTT